MISMRRKLLGLGFVAASSLLALHTAQAMSGPTAIQIDGGPLGPLQLSGGVDGYGYYLTGTNRNFDDGYAETNSVVGYPSNGAEVANALIELQKTDGVLQFTVEIGSNGGAISLGAQHPTQTSITTFTTGPLYAGYITIAPTGMPFTISAGQIASLEGYEAGIDWFNPSQLTTDIFYVQNSQSRGISGNYTMGPLSATVSFGDGSDSGVWNFIQALFSYTINSTNVANVYGAANLGRTGNNAYLYGGSKSGDAPFLYNSDMLGGFYSYTMGSLNVVPELQYVYAKADQKIGIYKSTANFGAAVFADYTFGTSPYSLGGWVEFEKSQGLDGDWFIGPESEGVGVAVSPTWQYKDLFARANVGGFYLLHNKVDGDTYGYGNSGKDKGMATGTLEAGLLF